MTLVDIIITEIDTALAENEAVMQRTFAVGYAISKDTLKIGRVDEGYAAVTVDDCGDRQTGRLIAEQMVAAIGFEPTSCVEIDMTQEEEQ